MPSTRMTVQRLHELIPEFGLIGDVQLRKIVERIWQQLWERSDYDDIEQVPVSLTVPYPQLRHTQAVVRMALAVADIAAEVHGTKVDRDVLIAGALLMDISKVVEYRPGRDGNERTPLGDRLPHGTATASLALEAELPLDVIHIVLAHSPNGGKHPSTVEAHILDWLDQLDLNNFGADLWKRHVVHLQR
jgi:23S rRNA maturation-related 3'-5' exoribonuclease YhaM